MALSLQFDLLLRDFVNINGHMTFVGNSSFGIIIPLSFLYILTYIYIYHNKCAMLLIKIYFGNKKKFVDSEEYIFSFNFEIYSNKTHLKNKNHRLVFSRGHP